MTRDAGTVRVVNRVVWQSPAVAALLAATAAGAWAQAPAGGQAQPPAPAPQQPTQVTPQPSAPTPPTPLPKKAPDTQAAVGVSEKDVRPTTLFNEQTPGQPLPGDPQAIRTLDDALSVAFRRSPSVLQAQETAVRTDRQVAQILALKRPQISAGVTYTRLANASSAFGGAGGGVTPSSVQNPFGVGLQITPPGSQPVTLSGNSGTGAGAGSGSAGAVGAGTAGQQASSAGSGVTGTAANSRAATVSPSGSNSGAATTRQTSGGSDNGNTGGNDTGSGNTGGSNTGGNSGGGVFGGGTSLDQAQARLSISQLIDITGIVRTAEDIGDLQKALTRLELARVRQQLALDVKNGYYNVLRAQAFVRVNEAAVAQSQEQLRVTEAQLRAGVASQFDVLRARTQLQTNQQALINSRNQVAIARNAFANTLGIDPSTPVEIADAPTDAVPAEAPALEEGALITQALTRRPEYLQADVNLLKASKNIRLARRNLEPYVSVGLSGTYNITEPALGRDKSTAAVSVGLTVPLYDGGATRAAVDAARSDERGAQITKDQYVRGIKAEVQQTIIAVRDAFDRSVVANASVVEAREALRLANVRYRAGVGTQLEVNDAQTALTQAETNQVNAQYDYLAAQARLQRATGQPQ